MQPVPYQLVIRSMKTQRREHMEKRFEKLSMLRLYLLLWLRQPLADSVAHEEKYFYKSLASLLSHKWGDEDSFVMGWLRCSLSFSLLRSAIQCDRGARSSTDSTPCCGYSTIMDLVRLESNMSLEDDLRR